MSVLVIFAYFVYYAKAVLQILKQDIDISINANDNRI